MSQKASITYSKSGNDITLNFHFNPSELTTNRSVKYASQKGQDGKPVVQFTGVEQTTLNMTLYFDTISEYEDKPTETDVRVDIAKLEYLLQVDPQNHIPPVCTFAWGQMIFKGMIDSLTVKYTMFSEKGYPVRATTDVTLKKFIDEDKSKSLESPDRTKGRTLKQTDTLWSLANEEYDDPALWRVIAVANEVVNPRKVPSSVVYKLPAID